ncbi:GntR family transcriptional regulator [candidate division KSB1 bacterium]|nr:GntR family transcriptional regulator [candidate division KSB1 bacterium]
MGRIDNSSLLPKYYQLKEILKEKIIAGKWKPGEKIAAEKELVNTYDCSMITVNKAVGKLVEEGYVFRERGRGTYVSSKSLWGKADEPIVLKLIGMVVPDVSNEFGRTIVRGIEDFLHSRGYSLILGNHDQSFEKAMGYVSLLLKKNIDGIIISPIVGENYEEKNARILKKLINRDVPFVLIDKYLRNTDCSYVVSDSIESSYKMTTNLIKSGHQKIAVLSGLDCSSFEDRLDGYKNALAKNNIPFDSDLVFECDERRIDAGDVAMITKFLETNSSFSAIFTFNATLAKGVILALEKLGKKIPGDITLVNYDNHILPHLAETLFTRIDQPIYKMGEKAAELLIQMIEKGIRKPKKVILKSEILSGKQDDIIVSS